tara:strand:+ start:600 stop:704 length:105 start_codon:yes stop_codon:yes gene_type:complete
MLGEKSKKEFNCSLSKDKLLVFKGRRIGCTKESI